MATPFDNTVQIHDMKNIDREQVEAFEELVKWQCCCSNRQSDSRMIKFLALYSTVTILFVFSMIQLKNADTCEEGNLYSSILTLLIGIVLPNGH